MKKTLVLLGLLIACGRKAPQQDEPKTRDQLLNERIQKVEANLPYCDYPNNFRGVSKGNCDDGDIMMYSGLLCLSGEEIGHQTVLRSVDETGRAWRSPRRINNEPEGNSFSRDMLSGMLGCIIKHKDKELAQRFWAYTQSIGGKLCPDATDNKCTMLPTTLGLLKQVWTYIGLEPTTAMKLGGVIDDIGLLAQSQTRDGYELDLSVIHIFLRQRMDTYNSVLKKAAQIASERQPENPWFELVYNGKTEKFIDLFLAQAPEEKPLRQFQWSITRNTAEQSWKDSMGWEFKFLYNLSTNGYVPPQNIQLHDTPALLSQLDDYLAENELN